MLDVNAFIGRWKNSGGSERGNLQSFLNELCDLLEVDRPDPSTDVSDLNTYSFERAVVLDDGDGRTTTNFIDLYKRGCFVLEGKQGTDAPGEDERLRLGGDALRRRAGTARRGTRGWTQAISGSWVGAQEDVDLQEGAIQNGRAHRIRALNYLSA